MNLMSLHHKFSLKQKGKGKEKQQQASYVVRMDVNIKSFSVQYDISERQKHFDGYEFCIEY